MSETAKTKAEDKFWRDFRKLSADDMDKAMFDYVATGAMYIRTNPDGSISRAAPDELFVPSAPIQPLKGE